MHLIYTHYDIMIHRTLYHNYEYKYTIYMHITLYLYQLQERMQDLEETVLSLKRVLNERERELGEYQAKTRTLETDLSRERSRSQENPTPVPRLESREEVCLLCLSF